VPEEFLEFIENVQGLLESKDTHTALRPYGKSIPRSKGPT